MSSSDSESIDIELILEQVAWYEAQLKNGAKPDIGKAIEPTTGPTRKKLFEVLLKKDIRFRSENNDPPTIENYLFVFPEYWDSVVYVCKESGIYVPDADNSEEEPLDEIPKEKTTQREERKDDDLPERMGPYRIIEELGRGSVGVVYRVEHVEEGAEYALKVLLAAGHASAEQQARFMREHAAGAAVEHENVVRVYEAGTENRQLYFAMELIDGGSLQDRTKNRSLSCPEAAKIVSVLARTAQYLHRQNIIHRDLKPSNILLTPDGTPKVSDFSIAKIKDTDVEITFSEKVMGTPSFMSPEQAKRTAKDADERSDIYSLGGILYQTLTGRPPFIGDSYQEIVEKVLGEDPIAPSKLNRNIPADLERICLKCLAKRPADRYGNAHSLEADLKRFLKGTSVLLDDVRDKPYAWEFTKDGQLYFAGPGTSPPEKPSVLDRVLDFLLDYGHRWNIRKALFGTLTNGSIGALFACGLMVFQLFLKWLFSFVPIDEPETPVFPYNLGFTDAMMGNIEISLFTILFAYQGWCQGTKVDFDKLVRIGKEHRDLISRRERIIGICFWGVFFPLLAFMIGGIFFVGFVWFAQLNECSVVVDLPIWLVSISAIGFVYGVLFGAIYGTPRFVDHMFAVNIRKRSISAYEFLIGVPFLGVMGLGLGAILASIARGIGVGIFSLYNFISIDDSLVNWELGDPLVWLMVGAVIGSIFSLWMLRNGRIADNLLLWLQPRKRFQILRLQLGTRKALNTLIGGLLASIFAGLIVGTLFFSPLIHWLFMLNSIPTERSIILGISWCVGIPLLLMLYVGDEISNEIKKRASQDQWS